GNRKYNSGKSSTFKKLGNGHKAFDITYEDGTGASGVFVKDTVTIGGIKVLHQTFGSANKVDQDRSNVYDGILGLTIPITSDDKSKSVLYNLYQQKKIKQPIFSFYLAADPSATIGGEFIIGGIDKSKYIGRITYFRASVKDMYQATFTSITVNNHQISDSNQQFYLDTGTAFIIGPPKQIRKLHQQIGLTYNDKLDAYVVNCDDKLKLPSVVFTIANQPFPLTPEQYIYTNTDDNENPYCATTFESGRSYGANGQNLL
ncbi:unnamed protein product, partial [Didymodactylos carnosus]